MGRRKKRKGRNKQHKPKRERGQHKRYQQESFYWCFVCKSRRVSKWGTACPECEGTSSKPRSRLETYKCTKCGGETFQETRICVICDTSVIKHGDDKKGTVPASSYSRICRHEPTPVRVGEFTVYCSSDISGYQRDIYNYKDMDVLVPLSSMCIPTTPYACGFGGLIDAVPFPDFGSAPLYVVRKACHRVIEYLQHGKKVNMFCVGGHGRTGTMLAALIAVLEPDNPDPVDTARTRYCREAVESHEQARIVFKLGGKPIPEKYSEESWYSGRLDDNWYYKYVDKNGEVQYPGGCMWKPEQHETPTLENVRRMVPIMNASMDAVVKRVLASDILSLRPGYTPGFYWAMGDYVDQEKMTRECFVLTYGAKDHPGYNTFDDYKISVTYPAVVDTVPDPVRGGGVCEWCDTAGTTQKYTDTLDMCYYLCDVCMAMVKGWDEEVGDARGEEGASQDKGSKDAEVGRHTGHTGGHTSGRRESESYGTTAD